MNIDRCDARPRRRLLAVESNNAGGLELRSLPDDAIRAALPEQHARALTDEDAIDTAVLVRTHAASADVGCTGSRTPNGGRHDHTRRRLERTFDMQWPDVAIGQAML